MLDRKEALVTVLRNLNVQAETIAASASSNRHPDLYSPVFKQQHEWLVSALHRTNAALNPALQRLRQVMNENAEAGSNGDGMGGGGLDLYHGVRVSSTVRTAVESSQENARAICQRHRETKLGDSFGVRTNLLPPQAPTPALAVEGGSTIESLLEASASLMLVLRQCAEQRKQNLMTAMDVEQCVGAALHELRLRCASNGQLFQEIESSVALLKNELLL